MAKTERDLFDTLRARGLRKSAASNLAKAFGRADNSPPGKGARRAVSELRDLVSELESRVGVGGGGSSRSSRSRSEAAKKAAATRKRKANERSRAAKKAAQTRVKSSSSRSTASRGKTTRARAKTK
jgi:hypothetical protein